MTFFTFVFILNSAHILHKLYIYNYRDGSVHCTWRCMLVLHP